MQGGFLIWTVTGIQHRYDMPEIYVNPRFNYHNKYKEVHLINPYRFVPVGPQYGPELIANGTFDSSSGWTLMSAWSISGGLLHYNLVLDNYAETACAILANKNYKIEFDSYCVAPPYRMAFYSNSAGWFLDGLYSFWFNAVPGHQVLTVHSNSSTNILDIYGHHLYGAFQFDNLSIKEIL